MGKSLGVLIGSFLDEWLELLDARGGCPLSIGHLGLLHSIGLDVLEGVWSNLEFFLGFLTW